MVAFAQQTSALFASRAAPAGPSRARAPLAARVTASSRFLGHGGSQMPSLNSAAAARRWSEAPGRRSIAPRASDDDDWEKLFKDLKPLAPDLSAAQLEVLERALAKGRRQVPIVAIAKELELSRDEVLAWVKSNASRVPELAKQYPPDPYEKVATVRLTERPEVDRREGRAPRGYDDDANYDSQTSYLKNAPGAKHVPKGMPAYKAYTKTRLGSNNVATLEKVYASDTHPSDDMVESVRRATKLPRSKIVAWFKTKREEDKMAKRRAVREKFGGEDEYDERAGDGGEDGFYERRGGGRGGGRGRGGRGGGRGRAGGGGMREGGSGDAYGARQERGRRDSTSEWSGRRG